MNMWLPVQELGREPLAREVAVKMKASEAEVVDLKQLVRTTCSLDSPINDRTDTFLRDVIEDPAGLLPDETADGVRRRAELIAWVKELPEKEQTVIVSRFGLNGDEAKTLEEIGREMGLTRERVRQIKEKAIRRLKHSSRSKLLKTYLG